MRPLKKIIDLRALRQNYACLQKKSGSSKIVSVVKANAYGHGIEQCSLALSDLSEFFAVSCIEEALQLRNVGIKQGIFLLEGFFDAEEIALCSENNFIPVIHSLHQLNLIKENLKSALHIFLKIDSGMHRLGFMPAELNSVIDKIKNIAGLTCNGVFSHFATADEPNPAGYLEQIEVLQNLSLPANYLCCYANSAAILNELVDHKILKSNFIRPGIALYGISPFEHVSNPELVPVMTLETEILATRYLKAGETAGYGNHFSVPNDGYLATIALGYGDGFSRSIESGKVHVLIDGRKFPIVGRVAMDMSLVWLDDVNFAVGEKIEIFGKKLSVLEVALAAGTIPYTLTTMLTSRVHSEFIR